MTVSLLVSDNTNKAGTGLAKKAIQFFVIRLTRKPATHVAVRVGDCVYESSKDTDGVVCRSFVAWEKDQGEYRQFELPGVDAGVIRERFREVEGADYDMLALWSFVFGVDLENPERFACHEFAAHLLSDWIPSRLKHWALSPLDFELMARAYQHGYDAGAAKERLQAQQGF